MTWTFPTSRVSHDGAGTVMLETCHRVSDYTTVARRRGQVFWTTSSPLPDGAAELVVHCPVCMADRGLTVSGAWGDPAQLTCLCGHSWTPLLPGLPPEQLLRKLIRLAVGEPFNGIRYRLIKVGAADANPTPLHDAVGPIVVEAGRDLNRGKWVFSDYEGRVASDLLARAGLRVYWSPEDLAALSQRRRTEEEQLARVVDMYRALATRSRWTRKRLGRFLRQAVEVMRPIDVLTMDDLEPGPTRSGVSPVLVDAREALAAVHGVLGAGATGDVDY
ncbi:hypothetical protein AB0E96_20520 [Kitasatospora sp. NPDC036755]|uniref:hypothetical protein n=1 Tax=Kitasatospora sp. NPDC036755 TaxID=3154600 RepID=UPI0033D3C235